MFQKVIVVLVGLVMSLVGAITPEGLFASPADDVFGGGATAAQVEQTLATVRAADGLAFAKLPVLWLEVDGRRVTEDAWGTGEVEELRFKVGVKGVESTQLAVGQKLVTLTPTDVLTIRTFRGDFAYRGMGTPNAAIQLQGTVQTTLLNEGAAGGKLRTEMPDLPGGPAVSQGAISYVVLDTGARLDTVAREPGGARFLTQEAPGDGPAGNVLAKWVKVDGQLAREYTWGDGQVGRIEFEPADAAGIVSFGGAPQDVAAGRHVVVKDFVGEYLVYQVQGGFVRLKLDGYAADVTTGGGAAGGVTLPSGPGAPNAAFDLLPVSPRTTDVVKFHDRSTDDGVIVFWRWDFGDGVMSALQDPTHRYARPGAYNVTLNVTDEDLRTTQTSRIVLVRNADPVADFEWLPRVVTTDSLVAFADLSLDADGSIANWTWDFGDGTRAYTRSPTHQFAKSGTLTVTLTVTDDLGGRATVAKQVLVRNHPPVASFEWSPVNPHARVPVTFTSLSTDRDGRILSWAWDFDGKPGADATGPTAAHTFRSPGPHPVTLTVTDDGGATDVVTTVVNAINTPPVASFDWDADPLPTVQEPVRFFNRATDTDGVVVLSEWTWGDGSTSRLVTGDLQRDVDQAGRNAQQDVSVPPPPPDAEHQYARPGTYAVELCVTDNFAGRACTNKTITIDQSAPIADITVTPNAPHYRGQALTFSSAGSRDPDGDPIVYRLMELGDGVTTQNVTHVHSFPALGAYPVKLTVRDATGREGRASMTVYVVNRPPSARIDVSDATPAVGQDVTFTATHAEDLDGPVSALNYTWRFQPSGNVSYGPTVTHRFLRSEDVQVILVVRDGDGGSSNQITRSLFVDIAPPLASFTVSDDTPNVGETVTFTDTSTTLNGGFTSREWTIGGVVVSTERSFSHTFSQNGNREVLLTVRDEANLPDQASRIIDVNAGPSAIASVSTTNARPDQVLTFRDHSTDPDGTPDIVLRTWDFGDGTVIPAATQLDVTHAYTRAGAYTATLTVSDGALTSSTTIPINVEGRRPIAKWHVAEGALLKRGSPVPFVSDSFDPDGSPLVRHVWSWGDDTLTTGGPTETHAYQESGLYLVRLKVNDGQSDSLPTSESDRYVRITASHTLLVDISALLPHGGLQDLTQPYIDLTVQHSPTGAPFRTYQKAALLGGPEHLFLNLVDGTWAKGDKLTITLRDMRYMTSPLLKDVVLTDESGATGPLLVQFNLALPLEARVEAVADESEPLLPVERGTVYDLDEPFHGVGHAQYLGGVPASGADVTVQLRYLPLSARDDVEEDVALNPNVASLLGWCTVHETKALADGSFTWRVTEDGCRLDGTPRGLGQWQVRAIARYPGAAPGVSAPSTFFVDPTGLLAGAALP